MRSRVRAALLLAGIIASVLTFALGCSAKSPEDDAVQAPEPTERSETTAPTEPVAKACADPRPELCTQDYRPVCGTRDTGIRCVTEPCPASEQKTYGNACSACSDPKVMHWVAGECPDPPDTPKASE